MDLLIVSSCEPSVDITDTESGDELLLLVSLLLSFDIKLISNAATIIIIVNITIYVIFLFIVCFVSRICCLLKANLYIILA